MIRRRSAYGLAALAATGVVATVGSDPIGRAVAKVYPGRGEVRSRGTNLPNLREVGPTIVARSGLVLIAVAVVIAVAWVVADRWDTKRWESGSDRSKWVRRGAQLAVAAGAAAWYGWLATPHQAQRSNARFHWVDYLSFDSDNFFYAAGRIPHLIFYDVPPVWQALNAALLVAVLAWISNRLALSTPASIAMCAAPIFASNLLMFADTAEDVILNITLLALLVAALLARRPVLVGLSLAAAVLGRPHFLVLVACLPAAEGIVVLRRRGQTLVERVRSLDWRFNAIALATMVAATFVAQVLFTILGRRYLFTGGRVIDTGTWDAVQAIAVDGFEISPFSGAYALHILWVLPLVLILGTVIGAIAAPRYRLSEESTTYFCVLAVAAIVVVHEASPLAYYNVRYLTYAWPFVFAASWIAYARLAPRALGWRAGLVVALAAGMVVLPVDPIRSKRKAQDNDVVELFDIRREVDALVGDGEVTVTFGDRYTRNVLAYVVRDDPHLIETTTSVDDDSVVITTRQSPLPGRTPTYETESLLVYAPA